MKAGKVLALYLEPTPYLLGLLACLQQRWPAGLAICFAGTNLSQHWELPLDNTTMEVLPDDRRQLWRHLRGLIKSGDYALVHLAGWGGHPALPMALLLAWLHGVPVTVESDTPLPPELVWWKRAIKRLVYPVLFRFPALFLPGGKRQAAMLAHYGVPQSRIAIAGMTVDVTAIIRHRDAADRGAIRGLLGIAPTALVLLYVGRMEPHKGIRDLLTAFRGLRANSQPVCLLMVGAGSLSAELQQAAAADPRIKTTGRLSGAALLDAYAAADVFVLPSHFEPWGLVVNEAMASALAVVVSERAGCADDLVQDSYNGYTVPAQVPAVLAETLQRLVETPGMVERMGQASRQLIADWTLEREADNMAAAWKRTVRSE